MDRSLYARHVFQFLSVISSKLPSVGSPIQRIRSQDGEGTDLSSFPEGSGMKFVLRSSPYNYFWVR